MAVMLWAVVALWAAHGTRKEGEPPKSAVSALSVMVVGLLGASTLAALELAGVALAFGSWRGVLAVRAWLLAGACLLPRSMGQSLTNDDPGHRLERIWQLHGLAGRLLVLGALAPLLVVWAWALHMGGDIGGSSIYVLVSIRYIVLCGRLLAWSSAWMRGVAAGLDELRLGLADLPPQPARGRWVRRVPVLGGLALVVSVVSLTPWPDSTALQRHLTDAGLLSPADGRRHWMVISERSHRRLVSSGAVRVDVAPSGAHITATVADEHPGFWVLWENLSWCPQQLCDLWDSTEVAFSEDGAQMLVGRRRGLLQVRAFPSGQPISGWTDHHWLPFWSTTRRVWFVRDVAHAITHDGVRQARDVAEGWRTRHDFGAPIQGFAVSEGGARVATLSQSCHVRMDSSDDFPATLLMASPVHDAALSTDGEKLAIASYGVGIWDVDDGQWLLAESSLWHGGAASVSWHSDDQMLAIGSTEGTLEM